MTSAGDQYSSNGRESLLLKGAISLDTRIVAGSEHISCDLVDEAVILSIKDGVYYGLNPVGSRIWALVQEPRTLREIRDILLDEYAIEQDKCTRDLVALVEKLREWRLVELGNGKRPPTG